MKTTDFRKIPTSAQLKENISRQFGMNVNLEKYSREQLEDMRNKLRTRVFQQEGQAGINDLLTNETYQKDKAMLALLNTRIKEMLGEDIKKLRDKMEELSEAKKGVRDVKHTKKAKGSEKAAKDYDGDGKVEAPKDEVWGSRAKAAAKAGKPFGKKEESVEEAWPDPKAIAGSTTGKFDKKKVGKGTVYSKKASDKDDDGEKKSGQSASIPTSTHSGKYGSAMDRETMAQYKASKGKTGKVVKGKAQSGPQPKDDTDESIAEEKPSAGMTKKEKSAVVKKAKAGGDIGKPGKGFEKVEKAAAKGGAKDPKAVAAAAMWKQQAKKESVETFRKNVKMVNEGLTRFLAEDEEGKAKAITAASDIVNDYTSWMQRVGQYQTKAMVELSDAIRADFGAQQAEQFKSAVAPALEATLATLMAQREAISNAVAVLAGEETAMEPMGAEPAGEMPMEPGMEPAAPDMMNEPEAGGDEFAASDAASGAGTPGREMRESRFSKKLAESHSIISKLAR